MLDTDVRLDQTRMVSFPRTLLDETARQAWAAEVAGQRNPGTTTSTLWPCE